MSLNDPTATPERHDPPSAIRSARERFFDLSIDMFCIGGFDGYFKCVNPAWTKILGWSKEELLSHPWLYFVHEDDRARTEAVAQKMNQGHLAINFENRYRTKEGQWRWIAWNAYPVPEEEITIGVARDITEQKEAAQELLSIHQRLVECAHQAGAAEVTTGVLHNVGNILNSVSVSTETAQKRLRHSKITYLRDIVDLLQSHQANLPQFFDRESNQTRIPEFLAALTQELIEEQQATLNMLEQLNDQIHQMTQIIHLQQHHSKVSHFIERVSIEQLIHNVVQMLSSSLHQNQIQVSINVSPMEDTLIDRHGLLQITLNLINNAIQALHDNSPENRLLNIDVSSTPPHRMQIRISDNGAGIKPEVLGQIFEYGFTTKPEGHGFGLHNASLLTEELGGHLQASSDGPGKGAVFLVDLPLLKECKEALP